MFYQGLLDIIREKTNKKIFLKNLWILLETAPEITLQTLSYIYLINLLPLSSEIPLEISTEILLKNSK